MLLNLVFVAQGGIMVAAITTFVSYLIYMLIIMILVKKHYKMKLDCLSITRIAVASFVMAILVYNLKGFITGWITLMGAISCAIIAYLGVLVVTKEVKNEINDIRSKFRRLDS